MVRSLILPALFLIATLSGCKKDSPAKISPTNLDLVATVSTDGSGAVTFHATADHTDHFLFYFGDGVNLAVTSTDGTSDHTYTSTDTYSVKVTAVSVDNETLSKTIDIDVQVAEPAITTEGYSTPDHYPDMTLVWSDEFNGDELNTGDWNYELGGDGWGNHELEFYQSKNTLVQDGYLIIKAKAEHVGNNNYTSSRLTTQGKQTFQYGRIDIRALLPKGKGIWPALWMLGSSITTDGWPACGEVDIMELIGGGTNDSTVYGTAHWDEGGHAYNTGHKSLTDGSLFADKFHVFSIVWTAESIIWYVDDVQYHSVDISQANLSELRAPFFFIFNVAVGGDWPGNPDGTTVFPQRMVVDYIRVFQ